VDGTRAVHEVRQFLGLCGYYRRYVQDYAQIAAPLHELTKLGEQFMWTEVRDIAYEKLKTHLVMAPILAMSLDVGEYTLDVDASNWAAGAVLQQEQGGLLRVIGYASKAFTGAEKRYCITQKGLAAMIFGMKNYRQYLLGRKFIIRTDHAALSYLMTAKPHSAAGPVGRPHERVRLHDTSSSGGVTHQCRCTQ